MSNEVTAPSPSVNYAASGKFLGELSSLQPEIQQEVVSLIRRITKNPYDPEIVRRVSSVSDDNLYFSWTLGNGDRIFWKVEVPGTPSIVRMDEWKIIFLAISKKET
jgi:hypothetical protein